MSHCEKLIHLLGLKNAQDLLENRKFFDEGVSSVMERPLFSRAVIEFNANLLAMIQIMQYSNLVLSRLTPETALFSLMGKYIRLVSDRKVMRVLEGYLQLVNQISDQNLDILQETERQKQELARLADLTQIEKIDALKKPIFTLLDACLKTSTKGDALFIKAILAKIEETKLSNLHKYHPLSDFTLKVYDLDRSTESGTGLSYYRTTPVETLVYQLCYIRLNMILTPSTPSNDESSDLSNDGLGSFLGQMLLSYIGFGHILSPNDPRLTDTQQRKKKFWLYRTHRGAYDLEEDPSSIYRLIKQHKQNYHNVVEVSGALLFYAFLDPPQIKPIWETLLRSISPIGEEVQQIVDTLWTKYSDHDLRIRLLLEYYALLNSGIASLFPSGYFDQTIQLFERLLSTEAEELIKELNVGLPEYRVSLEGRLGKTKVKVLQGKENIEKHRKVRLLRQFLNSLSSPSE